MLYSILCYKEVCYKGTALYDTWIAKMIHHKITEPCQGRKRMVQPPIHTSQPLQKWPSQKNQNLTHISLASFCGT